MKYLIFVLYFAMLSSAQAGIYKWVDEDGNIHFSDQPTTGASEIELTEPTVYSPGAVDRRRGEFERERQEEEASEKIRYGTLRVSSPQNGATVRSNNGEVSASFSVSPRLQKGHAYVVFLDDQEVASGLQSGSAKLNGVNRGSHTLHVKVVDSSGAEQVRSSRVIFYVQAVSILRKKGDSSDGSDSDVDAETDGDSSSDSSESDTAPYNPSFSPEGTDEKPGSYDPDYTPQSGGGYSPSTSTPNYAPSFTPSY